MFVFNKTGIDIFVLHFLAELIGCKLSLYGDLLSDIHICTSPLTLDEQMYIEYVIYRLMLLFPMYFLWELCDAYITFNMRCICASRYRSHPPLGTIFVTEYIYVASVIGRIVVKRPHT